MKTLEAMTVLGFMGGVTFAEIIPLCALCMGICFACGFICAKLCEREDKR